MRLLVAAGVLLSAVGLGPVASAAPGPYVERSGHTLTASGHPFRFGGADIYCATDGTAPWTGRSGPGWYRVVPYTLEGGRGPASPIARLT